MEETNTTPVATKKPGNGLGIASLIISIFAVIFCWIPIVNILGLILGLISLTLGIIGMIMASKKGGSKGLSLTGVILSAISIIVFIAMYASMAAAS